MAAPKSPRQKAITQDDLFEAKYVCDATLSPDGKLAAYVLSEAIGKGNKESQRLSICLVPTAGGKSKQLTRGQGSSYGPRFSASGETLYFLSTRDGAAQIFALPVDGGEAEAVTNLEQGVSSFEVTVDESLVFAALTKPPKKPSEDDHTRINRFWFRFDPVPGYLDDINQTLFIAKRGGKSRALTDGAGMIMNFAPSPDGKAVAYLLTGLPQHEFVHANLLVAPLRGKAKARLLLENKVLTQVAWCPNGETLVVTGQMKGLSDGSSLIIVDADTGKTSNRTASLDLTVGPLFQAHIPVRIQSRLIVGGRGNHVYACIARGGQAHPNRISLKGKASAEAIGEGEEVNHLMGMHGDSMLIVNQSVNQPPALFLLNRPTGEKTRLTTHNEAWHKRLQWPTFERLVVKVRKNVEVEGWVLKPGHARAPYKTILNIHGGPHGGYGCTFWADMHELVGAGYAVAFINPRGSTGYGLDFMQSIFGRWGYPELEDFNAFLDELVKRKIAHPDKLGVTGISGGGHLSGWLIGHTDRFKAAVPEQGVYNMLSMWGVSDAGQVLIDLELGSKLHKDPMKYWKHSPVAYANKCKTPTLLLQGEDDVRCPMTQAEEYFSALKYYGCEVELIRMKHCNHGAQISGRPALRRFRMNVLRDWFDRHI